MYNTGAVHDAVAQVKSAHTCQEKSLAATITGLEEEIPRTPASEVDHDDADVGYRKKKHVDTVFSNAHNRLCQVWLRSARSA